MKIFFAGQGRTRVFGPRTRDRKATIRTPQPETRGERSPAGKRPFMDGHIYSDGNTHEL